MAPQLFWIGLGNMGRGMCRNLIKRGSLDKILFVYNRTKKRSEDFVAQVGSTGAKALDSIHDGVRSSDIIFTCLSNDSAVFETYEAIVKEGNVKDKLFVECSTISPDSVDKIAGMMIALGAEFICSPVFGPPQMAEEGSLVFTTAGPKSSIERLRPFVKGVMGLAEISFEGQPYSNAAKFKLIGNGFALNAVSQIAESLTLAEKSGVDPSKVKELIDMMYGGIYSVYSGRMLSGEYWKNDEPYFSANNGLKDIGHILSLGHAADVRLMNADNGRAYLEQVVQDFGGNRADIAGIYGAVRKANGLKYENDA